MNELRDFDTFTPKDQGKRALIIKQPIMLSDLVWLTTALQFCSCYWYSYVEQPLLKVENSSLSLDSLIRVIDHNPNYSNSF